MDNPTPEGDKKKPDESVPQSPVDTDIGNLKDTVSDESYARNEGAPPDPPGPTITQLGRFMRWWQSLKSAESTNRVIMGATVVIAAATITQGVFAYFQWQEMIGAGAQTDKIICADERIAKGIENSNINAATVLNATIDQFHLEQRAWVATGQVSGIAEVGKTWQTIVTLKNTGKTLAKDLRASGIAEAVHRGKAPDFNKESKAMKTASVSLLVPEGYYEIHLYPLGDSATELLNTK